LFWKEEAMGSKKRIRRDVGEWKRLVARYESSNLSRTAFCKREGINPNTFRMWKDRLTSEGKGNPLPRFVELAPAGTPENSWAVEVTLPHGVVLRMRG